MSREDSHIARVFVICRSYLVKPVVDDKEVTEKNEKALKLKNEIQCHKLESFIFNEKMICFKWNKEAIRMSNFEAL